MQPARTRLTVEAGALLFLLVLILPAAPAVQGQRRPQQPSPGTETRDRYLNPRETDISLGLNLDPRDVPDIPPIEPAQALATFRLRKGFRIELAAHEPMVVDPTQMAFDEHGRL